VMAQDWPRWHRLLGWEGFFTGPTRRGLEGDPGAMDRGGAQERRVAWGRQWSE